VAAAGTRALQQNTVLQNTVLQNTVLPRGGFRPARTLRQAPSR
jgi:hypothetical protein